MSVQTMQAVVLRDGGPTVMSVPAPGFHGDAGSLKGEALVDLHLGGICATDLELVKGYMSFRGVLGHEFVGVVRSAPSAPHLVGLRVVGDINCPCGACEACLAGRGNHCPDRTVLGIVGRDGAFSEQISLPAANLHRVPDGVPDEAAVFVEPLAAALRIVEQAHVRPTDRVLVLGLGRLGQLCARVLALTGAEVVGVSRRSEPLALLPNAVPGVMLDDAAVLAGADLVVDCTGSRDGLGIAGRLVRPGGTIVLKTTVHDLGPTDASGWVVDEITVIGSRCGPFDAALRLLAQGAVDPTPLVTAAFPLSRGVEALRVASEPGSVKVLLTPT